VITTRLCTPPVVTTRKGRHYNLCAIPIFAGVPIVAVPCAASAGRTGKYRWASYSAGSAIAMASACVLFGAAFGGAQRLAGRSRSTERPEPGGPDDSAFVES
jgi:hypothetical protein